MSKLNATLIMSPARHHIDGLIERVVETMQIPLSCYPSESFSDWASHLPIFVFSFSTNEISTHFLYDMCYYEYQPAALVDRLWPMIGAQALDVDRLSN